mmetsp:Transcript_45201/g.141658  ORF Transcript_45201/g.141658 Transcript_45201/m.141658 type:complete len:250 (+) Transcript_45201:767-1516(+)
MPQSSPKMLSTSVGSTCSIMSLSYSFPDCLRRWTRRRTSLFFFVGQRSYHGPHSSASPSSSSRSGTPYRTARATIMPVSPSFQDFRAFFASFLDQPAFCAIISEVCRFRFFSRTFLLFLLKSKRAFFLSRSLLALRSKLMMIFHFSRSSQLLCERQSRCSTLAASTRFRSSSCLSATRCASVSFGSAFEPCRSCASSPMPTASLTKLIMFPKELRRDLRTLRRRCGASTSSKACGTSVLRDRLRDSMLF